MDRVKCRVEQDLVPEVLAVTVPCGLSLWRKEAQTVLGVTVQSSLQAQWKAAELRTLGNRPPGDLLCAG